MDVVLLRWPGQEGEPARLASAGVPRLLLVDRSVGLLLEASATAPEAT
jgi:hypothetical protein